MLTKKFKSLIMASLVLCMVFAPISAQAGSTTGATGTATLIYSSDYFYWTVYPNFPSGSSGSTNGTGTINIYKIVGGSEVHDRLINIGHVNPGTTSSVTGSRPCGLAPGTYKAYLTAHVTMNNSPYHTVSLPIPSETFTITSSTSTPCYNGF